MQPDSECFIAEPLATKMISKNFTELKTLTGVIKLSEVDESFEKLYLEVRDKEKRIYRDDELKLLPFASKINPHIKEWNLRAKSFLRFKNYLAQKKSKLNIMDLGCGNGWFSGQLAKSFEHNFFCVDINLTELEQAARVFSYKNIKFIYAYIFTAEINHGYFDLIIINAAVQYFPDLKKLLESLLLLAKENGEIHIIDSPFYSDAEAVNAKERTKVYYNSLGLPLMERQYFHHTFNELKDSKYKFLYKPALRSNVFRKLFYPDDSPFPWILISK